jgi:hypothetical protein
VSKTTPKEEVREHEREQREAFLDGLTLPTGQVRPFFYYELSTRTATEVLQVCFQCLPCGDMLMWGGELWQCPECAFPLTPAMAAEVLDDARDAITHVRGTLEPPEESEDKASTEPPVKQEKKKRCLLARFFRRRPRRLTSEKK